MRTYEKNIGRWQAKKLGMPQAPFMWSWRLSVYGPNDWTLSLFDQDAKERQSRSVKYDWSVTGGEIISPTPEDLRDAAHLTLDQYNKERAPLPGITARLLGVKK